MKKWQITICCVVLCSWPGENSRHNKLTLLPGNNILSIFPEFLGQPRTTVNPETSGPVTEFSSTSSLEQDQIVTGSVETPGREIFFTYDTPIPPDRYPVTHAGVPRGLNVTPLPLENGDHELVFNISWLPSLGPPAKDYSLEIVSETETVDCRSQLCVEYDIPGDALWHLIPKQRNPVSETCTLRPGCAYKVKLVAHPWDGHTAAYKQLQLNECEAGVCSCAHAPRLPAPTVQAHTLAKQGQIVANISWHLPPPRYPLRLPPHLKKLYYFVSIGKQMVSDAVPSPWFAHTVHRIVETNGPVAAGDDVRWILVPIDERSVLRNDKKQRDLVLDVKLLARVSLVDERGCRGPAGNATAYDPAEVHKARLGTYALWAAFGGACVLTMVAILACSSRVVKRVLNAFRPAPVSAPLEPLCRRPAWFPLQLRE